MTPSPQQQTFYDWVRDGSGSAVLKAAAGAGKTTTIVNGIRQMPQGVLANFLAFNKDIADSLKAKLPYYCPASTFHSCCLAALRKTRPKTRVFVGKTRDILKELVPDWNRRRRIDDAVIRLVSICKSNPGATLRVLFDYFGMTHEMESTVIETTAYVLEKSRQNLEVVDFDDMLLFALLPDVNFQRFDFVFIDEAQDTNGVQRELLAKMLKPTGRLIAVGDENQAIYGFRGAGTDSLDRIIEDFKCEVFPLSVSYRCSRKVIQAAQKIVPTIQHREDAPEGAVGNLSDYTTTDFLPTDAILCRNNAPLIRFAFQLIRRQIGVRILGRDIKENLIKLVNEQKALDCNDLIAKINAHESKEVHRLQQRNKLAQAEAVHDKCESIRLFAANANDVVDVLMTIESLFDETRTGVIQLATIHKSKGLEWERVFILDRFTLMPSKYAKEPWEVQQEQNLIYVATTRAKLELVYIKSNNWEGQNNDGDEIDD